MTMQHKPGVYDDHLDAVSAIGLWVTLGFAAWMLIAAIAVGVYRLAF